MRGRPARRPPARSYRTTAIEGGAGGGEAGRVAPAARGRKPTPRAAGLRSDQQGATGADGHGAGPR